MKKFLALLLAFAMVFCLAACGTEKTSGEGTKEPDVVEPTGPVYEALELNFKNKTGVEITGLYLYESGAADKGHSMCISHWPDKDANGDLYEFNAFIYRPVGATMDLYVEFADGTNATWSGLTVANYDKLSLKGGVDPAGWEQEPVDDAGDKALMDEVAAKGLTSDGFYPGFKTVGIEIKNKTDKNGVGLYFYEEGGDAANYPNTLEAQGISSWAPGKGGEYLFGYFVRPVAGTYTLKLVYDDGTELVIEGIDFDTPDADGNIINEISIKDTFDPDLAKITFDDGLDAIEAINDATVTGAPLDGYVPAVVL